LPFSTFCHSPAADGSAACAENTSAAPIASPIASGNISRNLDNTFRISIA